MTSHMTFKSSDFNKGSTDKLKMISLIRDDSSGGGEWRPRGLMDMASDFGSEDCGFESRRGQYF